MNSNNSLPINNMLSMTQQPVKPSLFKNPDGSFKNPEGLQSVFVKIYALLFGIAFAFILIHFIVSIIDVLKYIIRSARQKGKLSDNGKIFNKDSNEHKLLHYTKYIRDGEPYNIYLQQVFVDFMYVCVSLFIIALAFQIGVTTTFILINKFKGLDSSSIKFALPTSLIASIVVVSIFAYILSRIYDIKFVKDVRKLFLRNQSNIDEINNYIYNNMTTNQDFLDALLNNDKPKQYEILNKQNTYYGLSRMLFTLSLYEHFTAIKQTSEEYNDIREIFTIDQIKLRSIKPIDYLYYNENINIKNYYHSIKNNIKPIAITSNNVINESKEYTLNIQLDNRLAVLNNKLLTLNKISKSRSNLLTYLLVLLVLGLFMVISFSIIYFKDVAKFIKIIKDVLSKKTQQAKSSTN